MENKDLYKEYEEIKNKILLKEDKKDCFILNFDVIKFLKSLCLDLNKGDKVLIPNVSLGELALCVDDAFVINNDFLDDNGTDRYKSILLFPPVGKKSRERSYLEKCLSLLDNKGKLIALVPQYMLKDNTFKELRERIISEYSLTAVFKLNRISDTPTVQYSIIIIENTILQEQIYMTNNTSDLNITYNNYKQGLGGFFVEAIELYDRIDTDYYIPEYKKLRALTQNKNTVKLLELADIFSGCIIPGKDRKQKGDYLVIKSQYIHNNKIYLDKERNVYCDKSFLLGDRYSEKYLLKKGDILVSTVGDINWAVYTGEDNHAIANNNVAIIRGNGKSDELVNLFFNSRTGIEYLEYQLKLYSHHGVFNRISIASLKNMVVPDIKMMSIARRVGREADLEAKVAALFRNLGWDVKEDYRCNHFCYDIALFDNDVLNGIIEIKQYKEEQLINNTAILRQLSRLKQNIGDAKVYLFIDDELFEFRKGFIIQLPELPRPNTELMVKETNTVFNPNLNNTVLIEKLNAEEMSLTDKLLMEIMTKVDIINDKVDDIAKKLEQLTNQISNYQSLVKKQLDLAISSDEEERIIHAFCQECSEKILDEVNAKTQLQSYDSERNKLILSFGQSAWNKMEESSKSFLISAKVMFNNLINLNDIVDYSGVCLLVTKALEVEMGKRFCRNYLTYLRETYPGRSNYPQYPSMLLNRYGKPIKPHQFTLGTVAYVLCYLETPHTSQERLDNNKAKLLEYAKAKLFSDKADDEIFDILSEYAEMIEEVKKDYRNPSAHTNELRRIDAEHCFELVLDVEKLMKRMLDSFDE